MDNFLASLKQNVRKTIENSKQSLQHKRITIEIKMLKVLPSFPQNKLPNAKCGEIFCQSSMDFTIICTFCDMKSFEFEDFLLHFRNVHLESSLKQSNLVCENILEINIKNEEVQDTSNAEDALEDENTITPSHNNMTSYDEQPTDQHPSVQWNDNEDDSSEDDDDDDEWHPTMDKGNDEDHNKPSPTKDQKKFGCDQCKKRYKTEVMLKQHIQKYHIEKNLGPNVHKCTQCSEEFPLVHLLNTHVITEHLGFKCTQCDRKYKSKAKLRNHEVRHTGIRNFVCDFENCGKGFFFKTELTKHQRIHTEPKKYICETCGYTCHIKESLRVHYRSHTGEKPYACSLCDKRFRSSSLLKEHQPIHSKERPHVCNVCGAAFSRPKALYHHKHLHLGIKKFKCKLCGNAYAQAAGLAGHMRQHKANIINIT